MCEVKANQSLALRGLLGQFDQARDLVLRERELVAQRIDHGTPFGVADVGVGAHHLDQHHRCGELQRMFGP